jgi:hypothetical protein
MDLAWTTERRLDRVDGNDRKERNDLLRRVSLVNHYENDNAQRAPRRSAREFKVYGSTTLDYGVDDEYVLD